MILRPDPLKFVPYEEYREYAQTGDIGLSQHDGFFGRQIQKRTKSDYDHTFVVGWCGEVLMLAESYERYSQVTSLRWRVRQESGRADIYRLKPEIARLVDLEGMWESMLRFAGQDYPEDQIVRILIQLLADETVKPTPNSDDPEVPRTCSSAVHWAGRMHGMPPMNPYDSLVFPAYGGDNPAFSGWGGSGYLDYVCTPVW